MYCRWRFVEVAMEQPSLAPAKCVHYRLLFICRGIIVTCYRWSCYGATASPQYTTTTSMMGENNRIVSLSISLCLSFNNKSVVATVQQQHQQQLRVAFFAMVVVSVVMYVTQQQQQQQHQTSEQTSEVCETKFPIYSHTGAREIIYSETSMGGESDITDSEAFTGESKTIDLEANYGGGESSTIDSKAFTGGSVVTD